MATWGSLGGAWQCAAGASAGAKSNRGLHEAFGLEVHGADMARSRFHADYALPANAQVSDGLVDDEVPRVFSMQSQLTAAGGGFPVGFADASSLVGGLGAGSAGALAGGIFSAAAGRSSMHSLAGGAAGPASSHDPCWVTVFGFPARTSSMVRQQLETLCGPIVEVVHGDGNFMHVRFHSAEAAAACLAQNGRAVLGKLLFGCVPCTAGLAAAAGDCTSSVQAADAPLNRRATGGAVGDSLLSPPHAREGDWQSSAADVVDTGLGFGGGPPRGPRAALAPPLASSGPPVSRGGVVWRLLDLLFDI
eukprot:TRINITY_DN20321_c0_g1_i1.p1 TRINITY_DN20321_c0_g1~~TRINITY_DN20321_c0_g1_i1.p1  ORF type:complete len:305 (-),score=43.43 TRINITY_DN20321_c0_g1_i1:117-1031(-)